MMKRVIYSLIILIFITAISYSGNKYLFIDARSGLALRSGPGLNFKKIETLPYNSQVMVLEYSKEKSVIEKISAPWVKVFYYGKEGWIFSGFTAQKPEKTFTLTGMFTDISRNDCFNLTFRDQNNKDWDFGDGMNNIDFDDLFEEVDDGEWKVRDKYKNKVFKIEAAKVKGKICEGCEGCRVDGEPLTIINLTIVDK